MKNKPIGYRWVILFLYFALTISMEIQWLAFASITEVAKSFYGISNLAVDSLSLVYMVVFIFLSLPASNFINKFGLRRGLMVGSLITGISGLVKGLGYEHFWLVMAGQSGLAIAQPFILNALTKLGAKWFPPNERATVAGIGTLAQYLGIIIALALTPMWINENIADYNLQNVMYGYGFFTAVSAILVLIFIRESPDKSSESKHANLRLSSIQSLKHIWGLKDMRRVIILFFIGLGIFNAISTCIDQITLELTMEQTGIVGGIMLIGGIIGALILPVWSDKKEKRKPFLVWGLTLSIPGVLGFTFIDSYTGLILAAFIFGFFIMSAGPIAFQYGAEKSYPASEATVQGLLLLAGQVSGILFVVALNLIGAQTTMYVFVILSVMAALMSRSISESYPNKNKSN